MSYEIHVKQLPPQVVVSERVHTKLSELGATMHTTLSRVAESVQPADAAQGAPFAVYYNEPFQPDDIDVEMGLPVKASAKVDETLGVHRRTLLGGPVAYTTHVGPYETIGAAYRALFEWVEKHGHQRQGPPREIYLVGPADAEPSAYRTQIEVPVD